MRMLKVLLGTGLAIGFGALAQTAGQTTGTSQSTSQNAPVQPHSESHAIQDTPTGQSDIGDLGTGGSGDGGMRHNGKHMGDGGMRHHGKHRLETIRLRTEMADAGM